MGSPVSQNRQGRSAAVLTPTGTWCEDAWLTTVALSQHTDRLKFLVADWGAAEFRRVLEQARDQLAQKRRQAQAQSATNP